jgi:uncharacterized membrane protein SpoIIM required for sporulation
MQQRDPFLHPKLLINWKQVCFNYISACLQQCNNAKLRQHHYKLMIHQTITMQYHLKLRAFYILLGVLAFLMLYFAGSQTNLDYNTSIKVKQEFMRKIEGLNYIGIFANNVTISIIMFIPGIGILFGLFSGYSTGTVFSAIAQTSQTTANQLSPLMILLTPFGIMEIFCYGLAISRSSLLLFSLIKRDNILRQFKYTLFEVIAIVIILFFAALIEWHFISIFDSTILNSNS